MSVVIMMMFMMEHLTIMLLVIMMMFMMEHLTIILLVFMMEHLRFSARRMSRVAAEEEREGGKEETGELWSMRMMMMRMMILMILMIAG